MAILRNDGPEIWERYISDELDWSEGKTKHEASFYAFLRAVTLGVPEATAKARVQDKVRACGGDFNERDHQRQWDRALTYAQDGLSVPGYTGNGTKSTATPTGTSTKAPKPVFRKSLLESAAEGQKDWRKILREKSTTWADTADSFLRQMFEPGEVAKVFLGRQEYQGNDWRHDPQKGDKEISDRLDYPHGVWFLPNPVDGERRENPKEPGKKTTRSAANVTAFRWALLESDKADIEKWGNMLLHLPLPIGAIYTSGGRSIHALVRVGVESREKGAWDDIVNPRKDDLVELGVDRGALSAVRLSRLPQCYRDGELQELLYINPECSTWPILGAPTDGDPWECFDSWFKRLKRYERLAKLDATRFDPSNPPPEPVPIFELAGKPVLTEGNLCGVYAQAKAGKTGFLSATLASPIGTGDTLGVTSANPKGHAVIHFDTEQSPGDHYAVGARALCRVGENRPEWFRSYSVVTEDVDERLELLEAEMERAREIHGGIHSVHLDGVADFCRNPNDLEEASALIRLLHQMAVRFETGIVALLHLNPKGEAGVTGRGHLGSELERKAETNLVLHKDQDGITTVFTERARHCHIPKLDGPRFVWSEEYSMHVSLETERSTREEQKAIELKELVEDAFEGDGHLKWAALVERIKNHRKCGQRTAETRLNDLRNQGFIQKNLIGSYEPTV